jgi:hypothetical protein
MAGLPGGCSLFKILRRFSFVGRTQQAFLPRIVMALFAAGLEASAAVLSDRLA